MIHIQIINCDIQNKNRLNDLRKRNDQNVGHLRDVRVLPKVVEGERFPI